VTIPKLIYKYKSCTENDDKATCNFLEDGESKTLDLVKNDGKWLVELKKESGIGKPKKKPLSDSAVCNLFDNIEKENLIKLTRMRKKK